MKLFYDSMTNEVVVRSELDLTIEEWGHLMWRAMVKFSPHPDDHTAYLAYNIACENILKQVHKLSAEEAAREGSVALNKIKSAMAEKRAKS